MNGSSCNEYIYVIVLPSRRAFTMAGVPLLRTGRGILLSTDLLVFRRSFSERCRYNTLIPRCQSQLQNDKWRRNFSRQGLKSARTVNMAYGFPPEGAGRRKPPTKLSTIRWRNPPDWWSGRHLFLRISHYCLWSGRVRGTAPRCCQDACLCREFLLVCGASHGMSS